MQVLPHVARLTRLLHNRVVRRVVHAHPTASALLAVGDLADGAVVLRPVAVWDAAGALLDEAGRSGSSEPTAWQALLDDLRSDLALLGRVSPVELFVPYVVDLRQLDLRLESDDATDRPAWY